MSNNLVSCGTQKGLHARHVLYDKNPSYRRVLLSTKRLVRGSGLPPYPLNPLPVSRRAKEK